MLGIATEKKKKKKLVLPFTSAHSKTVKLGIVKSLFSSFSTKSCHHLSKRSFYLQHQGLVKPGYPADLLKSTVQRFLLGRHRQNTTTRSNMRDRFAVIPYVHNSPHRLKAIASRYNSSMWCFPAGSALSSFAKKWTWARSIKDAQSSMPTSSSHAKNRKFILFLWGVENNT